MNFPSIFFGYETGVSCIEDGIFSFWSPENVIQKSEREMRDAVVLAEPMVTREQILHRVRRHHCIPIMKERASQFRQCFSSDQWILDIGGGTGWYWHETTGAQVILVDFSLEMLRLARKFLTNSDRVILLHADAAHLPMMSQSIAGWWSVQVFQHFPIEEFVRVATELERVLLDQWYAQMYNANPAILLRMVYRLFGKRLFFRELQNGMLVHRLTSKEWQFLFSFFERNMQRPIEISSDYSELFFHPRFSLLHERYPVFLEHWITHYIPWLSSLFARQVNITLRVK